MKIAIIGAGISGLVAANQLIKTAEVTIFEKARGVGGRMSTRYGTEFQFDHGAQHFTAKTELFKKFLKPLEEQKIIARWDLDFCEIDFDKIVHRIKWSKDYPHYVATPKMNSLCKYLATNLDVRLQTQVKIINCFDKKWQLFDAENNELGIFDWVISTAPAEQTSALMPQSFYHLETIKKTKMLGCFAMMLGFAQDLEISWQAALIKNSKISWISLNNSKPQRPKEVCLVANSTNFWAEENMEKDLKQVQEELTDEIRQIMKFDKTQIIHSDLHRWRYANISKQTGAKCLIDPKNNLAVCGDWLIQGRIESAFISAMQMIEELKTIL